MAKKVTDVAAAAAMKDWLDADVELQSTQAEKRREITPITQKYDALEKVHLTKKETAQAIVQQYAEENREHLLPKGAKSTDFCGGKIGWRAGSASLALTEGQDWEQATKRMAGIAPDFVIEKTELDKAGILRNAENLTDVLADAGLVIEQKETFFVKP